MTREANDPYGMYRSSDHAHPSPERHAGGGMPFMGAATLIGKAVRNPQNDHLGEIRDIMLDMRSRTIGYAVLACGGFLGMQTSLVAVPWDALRIDAENVRFVLNVSRQRLMDAPSFDHDRWPDMADPRWAESIRAWYATQSPDEPIHPPRI